MRYLVLTALSMLTVFNAYTQEAKKQITLEDIWKKGTFKIQSVPGFNAMQDGERYTQIDQEKDKSQSINIYDLASGRKIKSLFNSKRQLYKGKTLYINSYLFSQDERKMLLLCEAENIYRRSVLYRTYIYDIATQTIESLYEEKVLHPAFSPKGRNVAYVYDNNLYVYDMNTKRSKTITRDGERNKIINGNCDWVYEEEFEFTQAYQWSGEGNYIAFYRFDESRVPEYTMTVYDKLYPTPYKYKYPKAGEQNSLISIRIYNMESGQTQEVQTGSESNIYIPRIKWTQDDKKLCVYRLNRMQNKLDLLLADAADGKSQIIYSEENKAYIEINDNLEFSEDNESFIFNSEKNGFNHLYRWNWRKKELNALSKGEYDIETIVGIDQRKQLIYYTAAETSPLERQLYVVGFDGAHKKCLSPESGTHQITPCTGYGYFLDKHSRLNSVPHYYLRNRDGKIVRELENNAALEKLLQSYDLGKLSMIRVKGQNDMLNGWMITPPHFDSSKKYPVLMYQYSGPGSQMVADKFPIGDYFWHQMLTQKGYIIVCVDGTGTGFRGEVFKKKTYLQLGKYESEDQIAVAKEIGNWPFVDNKRIGIWGWSFGGFMSSTCLFKGGDVFKAGISVAPVTNWRYYDNIYTERYMRTPAENAKGYDNNAPEKMAGGLKAKFLLVHGTADDNVHFQNAVMLTEELVQQNKQFENVYYPNKHHGISGGNTRLHLYTKMTDFLLNNL